MHLVYITEPGWFEKGIPCWVQAGIHTVVTESDTVVNQAAVRGIEVLPLGKYLPSEKACEFQQRSIIQESAFQKRFGEMLRPEQHLSELLRGVNDLIYRRDCFIYSMEQLLESCNPYEITFVYGDRYLASIGGTPSGGWLQYILLSSECRNRNIRMKIRAHEFMGKRELAGSTRYDRYLSECTAGGDLKTTHNNLRKITHGNPENALFLYMYEMCKDDLEPLTHPDRWPENCGILTGKLSKFAPQSFSYDFDFSHAVAVDGEIYGESYRKLKKSIDIVLSELFSANFDEYHSVNDLVRFHKKLLLSNYKNCYAIIQSLNEIISKHNIKYVVLTGYSGPPSTVIASYFAAKGVEVTIRQHGGISAPYWPIKSAVEDCYYSVNSNFYKKQLPKNIRGCEVTPRKRLSPSLSKRPENISIGKYIIVTDDLFINAANKILNIKFFKEFVCTMPSEWSIVLRGHPRYFGNLIPGFFSPRITKESGRDRSILSSLSNACILVVPVDCFSSVVSDAIIFGVPTILVVPEGTINTFDFKPYAFGYPISVSRPTELIDIITRIKSDTAYSNSVLSELNTWLDSILGKPAERCEMIENGNNGYMLNKRITESNMSLVKYIKMLCKTKIKLMINRWHMFLPANTM